MSAKAKFSDLCIFVEDYKGLNLLIHSLLIV